MSIFHLPDLGEGLADATVVRWHVQAGDEIRAEQLLVSVETDKAIVDIPSPQSGRIEALLAKEGDVVPTHAPLVRFADGAAASSDAGSVVGSLPQHAAHVSSQGFLIGRHRHTEARLQQSQQRRAARATTSKTESRFEGGEPLDPMRRAMAEHMARAHREIVPVTVHDEATILLPDVHALMTRLVQAIVVATRAEPALNAWYDGEQQLRKLHEAVHVGIAVDTAHGLYVPVLQHAERLSAEDMTHRIDELKQMARERRLTADQQAGATFTLSNFGSMAGHFATPLVMPPQVAILGVGHLRDAVRDKGSGRNCLPLSLTVDHRAVTGGEAARFLAAVMAELERA